MKKLTAAIAAVLIAAIGWVTVLKLRSPYIQQAELLKKAAEYMDDKAYISAIPLLTEAAALFREENTGIEKQLKTAYLELGYLTNYESLIKKEMRLPEIYPDAFNEAFEYYISREKISEAISVRKLAYETSNSPEDKEKYEAIRYAYTLKAVRYDAMSEAFGDHIVVYCGGYYGLAALNGSIELPCVYEVMSTFDEIALVKLDDEIYAVNLAGQRTALLNHERLRLEYSVTEFGNYSQGIVPLRLSTGSWVLAEPSFSIGTTEFEGILTFSGAKTKGFAAARSHGKWGVIGKDGLFSIPPDYISVISDELGRSYNQSRVFADTGEGVVLLYCGAVSSDGTDLSGMKVTETLYEDARPFSVSGFAAVKLGGKWGFIDRLGNIVIEPVYEDALSFSDELAAVKENDLWGYISAENKMVISPQFSLVRSFVKGRASAEMDGGWVVLSLIEKTKGETLF